MALKIQIKGQNGVDLFNYFPHEQLLVTLINIKC